MLDLGEALAVVSLEDLHPFVELHACELEEGLHPLAEGPMV